MLQSVSQKFPLYTEAPEDLQQRGMGRRTAIMVVATHRAVPLVGEWLEAFWCQDCDAVRWYHVRLENRVYEATVAPLYLWQQAMKVINPNGNPSVGDFTRRQARMLGFNGVKDFRFVQS